MTTTPSIETELRMMPHGVDRGTVGAVLVAPPSQRPAASAAASVDPGELHGEVAIGAWGCGSMPGSVPCRRMDELLLEAARAAVGFMPDDEGLALHAAGRDGGGGRARCSRSGRTAASRPSTSARRHATGGTIVYTVDHHRGSEENQAGWEHHDERLVDPRTGRMDTLPFFRRTIEDAGLEDVVVAVIGASPTVAAHWATPLGSGVHRRRPRVRRRARRLRGWARHVAPGGLLVFHDVFEDPADGGQAPYEVWQRAVADGFTPAVDHRQPPRPARAPTRSGVKVGE